jgi:hypothetical protein
MKKEEKNSFMSGGVKL